MPNTNEPSRDSLESIKVAVEVMKHLTTLSTGTVVVMVGFYERTKLFASITAVAARWMTLSVVFSLVYLFLVGVLNHNSRTWWTRLLAGCAFVCFAIGATALGSFLEGYFGVLK